tara:strand:- start:9034 stop:9450 length:417 start_codon:yes stop_codon:yes gene_type:complete
MKADKSNLFVYGTLKKEGNLHSVLGNSSEFLGTFKTVKNKFDMHDYGCPIMVMRDGGFKIKGELYSVTPECMARVTTIECGAGYVPFIVETEQDQDTEVTKAIAFVYPSADIYAGASATYVGGSLHIKENNRTKEWVK